jgi:hypothetical protein
MMAAARQSGTVGFAPPLWWAIFALATVGLSLFFQTFKIFTLTPSWSTGLPLLAATALVFLTMVLLIYDGYAKEKAKGKVLKPFAPFEWLYARLHEQGED